MLVPKLDGLKPLCSLLNHFLLTYFKGPLTNLFHVLLTHLKFSKEL